MMKLADRYFRRALKEVHGVKCLPLCQWDIVGVLALIFHRAGFGASRNFIESTLYYIDEPTGKSNSLNHSVAISYIL